MINIIESYDNLIKQLNNNIKYLKAHRNILNKKEHKYLYPLFEKSMYIAISLSDLIIALKYLETSVIFKNEIEANFFSRNVALISYELIHHKEKIIESDVAKLVKEHHTESSFSEFKNCTKKLNEIIIKHHKNLNYIRNNLFGHRIGNGIEMASSMLSINNKDIYQIGKKIFNIYFEIFTVYIDLMEKL